jgi:hypothetical protein
MLKPVGSPTASTRGAATARSRPHAGGRRAKRCTTSHKWWASDIRNVVRTGFATWANTIWHTVRFWPIPASGHGAHLGSIVGQFRADTSSVVSIGPGQGLTRHPVSVGPQGAHPSDAGQHVARGRPRVRSKLALMGILINRTDTEPTVRLAGTRPLLRQCVAAGLIAVLVVLATACSDDDTASGDDETTTTVATTTTTQPLATDEASYEIVEELVLEATDLADELFQDPTVVEDPDNELLVRLREIYTDESPAVGGIEGLLRQLVADSQHQRASATGIFREVSVYAFEPVDQDTLTFDTCNQIDKETVDEAGEVVATDAQVVFVSGEARRVDGSWRFVGLSNDTSRNNPIEPGTSEPGLCAQLAAERDET